MVISATYHKSISFKYFINCDEVKRKVCKKAFCTIHIIGPAKVSHICKQVGTGQPTEKICHRGKHSNRPQKILQEVKDKVKQHFSSFPAEATHYSRSKNGIGYT